MTKIKNLIPVGTLIVAVVILVVVLFGAKPLAFGSAGGLLAENYIPYVMQNDGYNSAKDITTSGNLSSTGTFTVGSSGTALSRVNAGTCYIRPYATTITASSTAEVDCQATADWDASGVSALAGVTFGDFVVGNLSTTTAGSTFGGLVLNSASASTTAGYIALKITNLTGGTYTWPTSGTASGTASYIIVD